MDVLRTPKSSSFTKRRSLFPHLENIDLSPNKSLSTSPSSRRSNKKKDLPAKFRQEMPRQSQVDNDAKENQVKMSPIKKSSFYSNANYVPKWQQNLDTDLETKMVLKTPSPKSSIKKQKSASKLVLNKNGINKGVSHSIKKPKIPKKNPEKPKSGSESQSEESESEIAVKKIPVPKKLTELIYAPDSGKLSMAKDKSVCYDIKNGQMTFKYTRRGRGSSGSPRKSPYFNKLRTPNSDPKTPKQLFTPSSKSDFINEWQESPDRNRRRHQLPSPVKFHDHNDDDHEDSNMESLDQVSSIIESLEKSQDDYAMYVTDDELARVAQETVEELEDLRQHEKSNLNLELHEILAKIDPPTEQEIKEKRHVSNTLALELEDESSNEAFETPTKAKFFPVFDKNRQILPVSKNNSPAKNTRSQKLDKDQMIIDAGQSLTDLQTCLECSFVFNPGNQEDDAEHLKYHSLSKQGVKFQGWKSQRVVGEFVAEDAKIIVVKPNDHFTHWAKVNEVLNVVDKQLGIITDENSR